MVSPLQERIISRRREFLRRLADNAYESPSTRQMTPEEREAAVRRRMLQSLEDALRRAPRELFHRPRWRVILHEVSAKTGFPVEDLLGRTRSPVALNEARHECFYRIRKEIGMSTVEIAQRFDGRDHSTVVYGIRKHARKLEKEKCTTKTS